MSELGVASATPYPGRASLPLCPFLPGTSAATFRLRPLITRHRLHSLAEDQGKAAALPYLCLALLPLFGRALLLQRPLHARSASPPVQWMSCT